MEYNQEYNAFKVGELVAKEIQGSLSAQEAEALRNWKNQSRENQQAYDSLYLEKERLLQQISSYDANAALERVLRKHKASSVTKRHKSYWYVAASIALLIAIGTISYFSYKNQKIPNQVVSQYGDDVKPGTNLAYITLSDGKVISLDSDQTVLQNKDGQLQYGNGELIAAESKYATISTPKGGEYKVILPDGTKVWLNAESSLKYPIRFNGNRRDIEISGELYLEVAKDKSKLFTVETFGQRIEVLGTSFNIRSYGSKVLTTLIEGSIALTNQRSKERLSLVPGQQATVFNGKTTIENVDPLDFIAWKDGVILNKDATLFEICTELERWYGVKFIFPAGFNNDELAFNSINRNEMLSSVLAAIKNSYEVTFEIRGKEVFVR